MHPSILTAAKVHGLKMSIEYRAFTNCFGGGRCLIGCFELRVGDFQSLPGKEGRKVGSKPV